MENDEKKYEDVIKALKGLQQVKAPANFEADLQRRINSEKYIEEKKTFWENIFIPARLIPSLGLVAVAVIIFFVVDTNSEEMDNPFLIEPRVREDVVKVMSFEEVVSRQEELSKQTPSVDKLTKDKPVEQPKKNEIERKISDEKEVTGSEKSGQLEGLSVERDYSRLQNVAKSFEPVIPDSTTPAPTTENITAGGYRADSINAETRLEAGNVVLKEELNFRQVQLSEEEQKKVEKLKMQVQSLQKADKLK
jgi:hypothetical protein